jgi:hypothetical protein
MSSTEQRTFATLDHKTQDKRAYAPLLGCKRFVALADEFGEFKLERLTLRRREYAFAQLDA